MNDDKHRNEEKICDGIITIAKRCFKAPDIHQKIKKLPHGKKRIIMKKVIVKVDCDSYLRNGLISVQNCSNCWEKIGYTCPNSTLEDLDVMAWRMLPSIFEYYQYHGEIPKSDMIIV